MRINDFRICPFGKKLSVRHFQTYTTFDRSRHLAPRELVDYKLYVAERYASKEYLRETKREILDSICDLARRIEHPYARQPRLCGGPRSDGRRERGPQGATVGAGGPAPRRPPNPTTKTKSWRESDRPRAISPLARGAPNITQLQIRAPRAALIVQVPRVLTWAVGRNFVRPLEQLGVDAVAGDEPMEAIPPASSAFLALNLEYADFADQVAECDRAVARHHRSPLVISDADIAPPPRKLLYQPKMDCGHLHTKGRAQEPIPR